VNRVFCGLAKTGEGAPAKPVLGASNVCQGRKFLTYQLDVPAQNELHKSSWREQCLAECLVGQSRILPSQATTIVAAKCHVRASRAVTPKYYHAESLATCPQSPPSAYSESLCFMDNDAVYCSLQAPSPYQVSRARVLLVVVSHTETCSLAQAPLITCDPFSCRKLIDHIDHLLSRSSPPESSVSMPKFLPCVISFSRALQKEPRYGIITCPLQVFLNPHMSLYTVSLYKEYCVNPSEYCEHVF
jgi:hypothetical protein